MRLFIWTTSIFLIYVFDYYILSFNLTHLTPPSCMVLHIGSSRQPSYLCLYGVLNFGLSFAKLGIWMRRNWTCRLLKPKKCFKPFWYTWYTYLPMSYFNFILVTLLSRATLYLDYLLCKILFHTTNTEKIVDKMFLLLLC